MPGSSPKALSVAQLLEKRAEIDAMLPVKDLKDLDLSRELVLQVQALQALQNRVLGDDASPANQQAQVANALSSALTNLVRVQSDVFTSDRLKRIEAILIECVRELPTSVQEKFFDRYEAMLGA